MVAGFEFLEFFGSVRPPRRYRLTVSQTIGTVQGFFRNRLSLSGRLSAFVRFCHAQRSASSLAPRWSLRASTSGHSTPVLIRVHHRLSVPGHKSKKVQGFFRNRLSTKYCIYPEQTIVSCHDKHIGFGLIGVINVSPLSTTCRVT